MNRSVLDGHYVFVPFHSDCFFLEAIRKYSEVPLNTMGSSFAALLARSLFSQPIKVGPDFIMRNI